MTTIQITSFIDQLNHYIALLNQTTPHKRKTPPTSIMATYEEMSFVFSETFASYAELETKKDV